MPDVLSEAGALHRELQPLEDRARALAERVGEEDPRHAAVAELVQALAAASNRAFALGNRHDPTG